LSCLTLELWTELKDIYDEEKELSLISEEVKGVITSSLNERWKLFAEGIHLASFMLDPRYRNEPLKAEDYLDGERVLKRYFSPLDWEKVNEQFLDFRSHKGIFDDVAPRKSNPITYWRRLSNITPYGPLATAAIRILSFPRSCAAVERSFSVVRRIHTWQRNRLGRKKLARLVYVYLNTSMDCTIVHY
jgi:hypothetical protein